MKLNYFIEKENPENAVCGLPDGREVIRLLKAEAKIRVKVIDEMPDPDPASFRRTFYISPNGDDSADGRSPENAWKTLVHLADGGFDFEDGDAVLFERGGEWNSELSTRWSGRFAFHPHSGVTYSAYGAGPRPVLTNSIDASSPDCWQKTDYEGVWRFREKLADIREDIGAIIFDEGKAWGVKLIPNFTLTAFTADARTQNSGMVSNGIEHYFSGGTLLQNPGDIRENLEFIHDYEGGALYLRCNEGNPAEVFGKIRLCRRGHILLSGKETRDITVKNIALKYGGSHGAGLNGCRNVLFEGCEIGFMGGVIQGEDGKRVRFGNGIENWGSCDNFVIRNCHLYQCYDSAMTSQWCGNSPEPVVMKDVHFDNNVVETSNMAVELWNANETATTPDSAMIDCTVNDNYGINLGFGIGHTRPDKSGTFLTGFDFPRQFYRNCVLERNKVARVSHYFLWLKQIAGEGSESGLILRDNVCVLDPKHTLLYRASEDPTNFLSQVVLYRYDGETVSAVQKRGTDVGTEFYADPKGIDPDEEKGLYR